MNASERRQIVLTRLREAEQPLSASALARECSVSRQIIVGDIALLRAAGEDIHATPRGYLLQGKPRGSLRTIVCNHDEVGMEQELLLCVDNGCTVVDVMVEHPVYGQLIGVLQLSSRYDVQQFLDLSLREQAAPLSFLTKGIHIHHLICPDEQAYERVRKALREAGILLEE